MKLLLGGALAPLLHWGVNLGCERALGGSTLLHQCGLTGGLEPAIRAVLPADGLSMLVDHGHLSPAP